MAGRADGASYHRSKAIGKFLGTLPEGRLELVRQPSYSPQLNADEQVWNYLKNVDLKNCVFKHLSQLKEKLADVLEDFALRKNLIRSFFNQQELAFY